MKLATLLLFPLLAGYAFSISWSGSKYISAREDGYRLYFRAAFYGCFLFITAMLLYLYLIAKSPEALSTLNDFILVIFGSIFTTESHYYLIVTDILILTLLSGFCLGFVLDFIPFSKRLFYWIAIKNEDFERLIYRAHCKPMPISLTMTNCKVYVGYVARGIDPGAKNTHIKIWPILSGYRSPKDGKVKFTTFYDEMYLEVENNEIASERYSSNSVDFDDFQIVLPLEDIKSANLFDVDVYERFQKKHENTKVTAAQESSS